MLNLFTEIVSGHNIEAAYFELRKRMDEDGRSARYRGWDGLKIRDLELSSGSIIKEVQRELTDCQKISPAISSLIPKKNNPAKLREVFTYRLQDRVKAQAIYRIVEPHFEAYFSPWLFSYRSSHPTYHAARSTVRHYTRYHSRDRVLVADVSDYTKNIKADILIDKIRRIGFDEKTVRLIDLFIDNVYWNKKGVGKPVAGLVSGTPLISLFYNIYLDGFDKFCGPRVDFYRRVGDDLIMFDQDEDRLDAASQRLHEETSRLGIAINANKSKSGPATMTFNYLGYRFSGGTVGLGPAFWQNALKRWNEQFNFHSLRGRRRKREALIRALGSREANLKEELRQIAEQKKLINDPDDMRRFSEDFFKALTRFFFGRYTAKNRREMKELVKDINLVSPYKYFIARKFGYGKK